MEAAWLIEQLEAGRSIDAIATLADRSPSTVSYWLRKHRLEANGADRFGPRSPIDRDLLAALVAEGLSVPQIATRVDRSRDVVRRALRRHGLRTRGQRNRRRIATADGAAVIALECRHHGETDHVLESRGLYRCKRCRADQVSEHRRRMKRTLIEEAGGHCVACGYSRCDAALQFHHVDPSEKAFHLSLGGVTRSWAQVRSEAAKCVLLCATCHAEVEAGFLTLPSHTVTKTPRGGLEPPNLD